MQTNFITPQSIRQEDDINFPSISWTNLDVASSCDTYSISSEPLYCISGLWQERFRTKTNQLIATNFNIPIMSSVISGIEIQTHVLRKARIEDYIIQLTLNGELIGVNRADMTSSQEAYWENKQQVGDYHIYGGADDLWGTNLTTNDLQNSTFGVVIAYQSNERIPHRDLVFFNQLAIRINFA